MKRIIPVLIAAMLIAACGNKTESPSARLAQLKKERSALDAQIRTLEAKTGGDSAKPTPVTVLQLEPKLFRAYLDVQAAVESDDNIMATPQMMGTVNEVLVHVGQNVQKGQTLATLDAAALNQQIAAQDAQLSLLHSLYEKQQKLWEQQIGTQVQLLSAKANYDAATKQHAALVAQRNMYRIVSPIAGTVDVVDVKEGDAAQPGGPHGIRIVNMGKLKAEANLGELHLGSVKSGDPVTLIFGDVHDTLHTRLSYVAQSVDPLSRAFKVTVKLGSMKGLHPNMSARMRIANYEADHALEVPISAIQKTAAGEIVFVANGKTAKAVNVQTGKSESGMVEILGGLQAGDQVIVAGFEDLDTGTPISVQ
ncbi:MAG: efflux RND transporter periplasmic adaptor subunit [Bacteroidetes bacterium]|nr:efflux RND transporter periplasmic adaptor subunit [Bacteroidota bacterium]